jgi:translation initiation factor IF-1
MQNNVADGLVIENLPNATFRVKLEGTGEELLCYISGKMKLRWVKLLPGDRVRVETTQYDKDRGRIVFKMK